MRTPRRNEVSPVVEFAMEMAQSARIFLQSNFSLLQIQLTDILDIAILSFVIYKLMWMLRKTSSGRVLRGILMLLLAMGLSTFFRLTATSFLLNMLVEQDSEAEIVLYGISMGGATVMMTAGEELLSNVKCIIEDCGYSSVWDEFAGQLDELFGLPTFPVLDAASLASQVRAGFGFKEASAVEQLKRASVPMLFIHGEDDTFVPYWMLDVVYEACASPEKERLSVPGAGHGEASWKDPELYWSTVGAFLDNVHGINNENYYKEDVIRP